VNTFQTNWQEFFKPIVTPYELEVAFQPEQSWTGRYVLDFGKLLMDGMLAFDLAVSVA
jgi:diphthamide biosynthesis protein 2